MDTGEQYIKMCERAEEIQKLRPYNDDYYCELRLGISHNKDIVMFVEGERNIWLPHQDQLQEMVLPDSSLPLWLMQVRFMNWQEWRGKDKMPNYGRFNSMEQLWLAFVMKEKYNKIWNGENWIDS